ncbi:MAG: sulfotransferase family protein [Puniceicoccaceae bacterium]
MKKAAQPFSHPLHGADLRTLLSIRALYGPPDHPRGRRRFAAALLSAALRLPFTASEKAWVGLTRGRLPPMAPPVFIVGHWRSGTTHLFNILARSPRFQTISPVTAGLPWDFLILGRLLKPLLEKTIPKDRIIDNVPVTPHSPQEDEIALASMTDQSYYHGLYFPRHLRESIGRNLFFDGASPADRARWAATVRYFLEKVSRLGKNRVLLLKNPLYTARIPVLRAMFPGARFIHIHRHPREVIRSTRGFYRKLLPWLALQEFSPADIDEVVFEIYDRMMRTLAADTADLPPDQFLEIPFRELETDPMPLLERAFSRFGLDGWAESGPPMAAYLRSIRQYRKNTYPPDEEDRRTIDRRARFAFDRWGYAPGE